MAVFCCDDVGAIADELICRTEDEERRWLFREELDSCNSEACAELDGTAEWLDSAAFDIAELEWFSEVAVPEQEDCTELFPLELECCSEIVSCGETSVFEESPHDTINARHAKAANARAVWRIYEPHW